MVELRKSTRIQAKEKPVVKTESKITKPTKAAKPIVKNDVVKEGAKELQVGDEMPDLKLLNQDEKELSLKELAQEYDIIIIFAYPRASTPGCTRQACGFRDNYAKFNKLDKKVLVLGLSADSPSAQLKFKTKQGLQFDLLSDPKKELIGLLGAKKSPSGIKRSHWIFKNGELAVKRVQISPEISINEGFKEVEALA